MDQTSRVWECPATTTLAGALPRKACYRITPAILIVVGQLPPEEQDRIAQWLLGELEEEARWTEAFSSSQDVLSMLAEEARADINGGRATQLDPDKL